MGPGVLIRRGLHGAKQACETLDREWMDEGITMSWIGKYCRSHPTEPIAKAVSPGTPL
jgi:hypothetical protein